MTCCRSRWGRPTRSTSCTPPSPPCARWRSRRLWPLVGACPSSTSPPLPCSVPARPRRPRRLVRDGATQGDSDQVRDRRQEEPARHAAQPRPQACLLYTSDAADEEDSVALGGRRIIKKKTY